MKGLVAWALVTALIASAALAASCDVGDAICTDKTVEEDRNDNCPYGPPGGPQRTKSEACVVELDSTDCTVTFRDDVYPILVAPNFDLASGGGCTIPACHGETGTGSIALVLAETPTPDELYAALAAVVGDNGAPYVKEDADNAFILCNLFGRVGGGSAMPPTAGLTDDPATSEDDEHEAIINEWVRCGMKLDGGAGGGAEGGGGAGGGDAGGGGQGGGTGGAGGGV
ncbi:MAG: hypothetical protein HOW73_39250 [Polyangiaceae bacterium]|nr:hypothetical protein [Polyangiaceae bacterium]